MKKLIRNWRSGSGSSEFKYLNAVKLLKKRRTCNVDEKRIMLNLELTKKPLHCLEYIIVHELLHLLERLHAERFTALMNQFTPLW